MSSALKSIPNREIEVKPSLRKVYVNYKYNSGTSVPGGEDSRSAGVQRRAHRRPVGERCTVFLCPDGVNAINSTIELGSIPKSIEFPTLLDNCKHLGISAAGAVPVPIHVERPTWETDRAKMLEAQERIAIVLDEAGRHNEASKVRGCCSQFRVFKAQCCGDTLAFPYSCGHRLCPVCMRRRSADLADRVLNDILPKMKHPVHIILTVKNVSRIDKAYYKWLRGCFTKLRHREVFSRVAGGGYSIETTHNDEEGTWHVHLHILADVDWIPQRELSSEWMDITGSPVVWVRAVGCGRENQTPESAAKEISKYIVKPGKFLDNAILVDEYLSAVKGMRLWQTFGASFNLNCKDDGFKWPDCWCGLTGHLKPYTWVYVGDWPLVDVFRDEEGCYRRRKEHGPRSP